MLFAMYIDHFKTTFFDYGLFKENYSQTSIKDVRAKFSNIDFFPQILPLKDDELVMSEM